MDLLPRGKDKIFPHQVSCIVLMYHVCKHNSDDELSVLCKKWRCSVILLLLSLIQKIHMDYEGLLAKLERATSREVVEIFEKRMLDTIENKYMGLLDLFDSIEQLTVTGNHYVHRGSIFGIFLRRMYLQYQKMSFTDTGVLGKSVESYLQSSRVEEMHDISSTSDTVINHQSVKSEEPQEKIISLSEVDRFIASQTKLIELQRTNALPPRELHNKIQEIIQKFPSMIDAYYLSYLNQLQIGEVRNALFDLHRYFDYKKWLDDDASSEIERTSLEKHQIKFKRFRYCALNLGIFHFHHEHHEISLSALEEAIKMAQETNDNYCLLHAMLWLYQLKLEYDPKLAKSVLAQLNKKAKELGAIEFQILGSLLHCKSDAFGGNATFQGTLERLKEIDCACSVRTGISAGKIEVAKSAMFDFYGYRSVSSISSQMVLFYLQSSGDIDDHALIYDHSDPESSILAVCQVARCLADEGLFSEAEKIVTFGSSLIPQHSNLLKWLSICRWQLLFERCVIRRDLKSADEAINHLKLHDKDDAMFRSCVLDYLHGNFLSVSSKLDSMLDKAESRLHGCVGCTPGAVHIVRLLQLKAELFASSNEYSKAITYLTRATDICRRFKMRTMEAEISISTSHCTIFLGLPRHAKQIINEYMIRILSNGSLYARSMAFLVLAKTSLFSLKGTMQNSKSELLQLLPPLERSLQGCQLLGASAVRMELLCIMAHIYHVLEYTSKRNTFAKEFRVMHEERPIKRPVKLFI